ncbi:MAG TPA: hypothetical protein VFL54_08915, partial [Gammaproteobacteria bacterium]|nr:hypothetical protein [Gammaproteobacteria bacterium]
MTTPDHRDMSATVRSFDWASSPLGPQDGWSQSLKTAAGICLHSCFPMMVAWGPDLRLLYNDACLPVLGPGKHPGALGRPMREVWSDVWDVVGPLLEGVYRTGESVWGEDRLLIFDRALPREEVYFTFSCSIVRDDDASIGGIIIPIAETTGRVLGERRLRTLSELGGRARVGRSVEEVCRDVARHIEENPSDIPVALIYLHDETAQEARL